MSWSGSVASSFLTVFALSGPLPAAHSPDIPQVQVPARDPRPGEPRAASKREGELTGLTTADPTNANLWIELAKLQEDRGAYENAEETLSNALAATSRARSVLQATAAYFNRQGNFEKCIAAMEEIAARDPGDAQAQQIVAAYYYDKSAKDQRLSPADRERYADLGIAATDRALAVKEDYPDALAYKNLLLRVKASLATDASRRDALIAEADALRNRAIELNNAQRSVTAVADPRLPYPAGASVPPEPLLVDGVQPVRVGGNVKVPTKIQDVRPTYPEAALQASVSGMVILEAVIDTQGNVRSAKVLRSIPLLDAAAIEAVRGWRFEPPTRDGVPVPIVMTVTVNFTLK